MSFNKILKYAVPAAFISSLPFLANAADSANLKSDDFTLCLELPVLVHQQNFRYTEILSEERERYAGKTKVNAFFDGLKILKGIYSIKK